MFKYNVMQTITMDGIEYEYHGEWLLPQQLRPGDVVSTSFDEVKVKHVAWYWDKPGVAHIELEDIAPDAVPELFDEFEYSIPPTDRPEK